MANMADVEWATRLAAVINRHKNINVKKLSEHKDLGLEAKEKQKIEKKIEKGESPHEKLAQIVGEKGPARVKVMHRISESLLDEPGYKEFADDLKKEFRF